MHSHRVARVTTLSRERLMRRHLEGGEALKNLAAQAGDCCAEADGYSLAGVVSYPLSPVDPPQLLQAVDFASPTLHAPPHR